VRRDQKGRDNEYVHDEYEGGAEDDLECASASASTGRAALGRQIGAPLASEAPEGASLNN
jgi:hypothetical protein